LQQGSLPEISEKHNVSFIFAGKSEETATTLGDMRTGALIAIVLIFSILAWFFKSYSTPLIIMSIIPLSLTGVIIGHLVMGFDLTILSFVAILGLSGIVINDSIILVRTIEAGSNTATLTLDDIVRGTSMRLRAILLTSLTTIAGLTPMIFETSLQARFLIPMAVTVIFGLMMATFLVSLIIPALLAIRSDVKKLRRR
jgi:multidrug efflux pump subunit AcrB